MQERVKKRLTEEQLSAYKTDGFVLVHNVFTEEELRPVQNELADIVDKMAEKLYAAGKIADKHEDKGFFERLTAIEKQFTGAAVLIHTLGIMGPELAKIWTHASLIDLIEQVLVDANPSSAGSIAGHPVWNIRTKTPSNPLATVPWHQDTAYMTAGSEITFQPTIWIPLCNATVENGTLRMIKGGHTACNRRVLPHYLESGRKEKATHSEQEGDSRSWYIYIKEQDLPAGERVICEVPLGSVLMFNNWIPHCSTENLSEKIRWSLDIRYQRSDEISGYEGIKEAIPIREVGEGKPDLMPDFWDRWYAWSGVNRNAIGVTKADPFDYSVTGPWMARWTGQVQS